MKNTVYECQLNGVILYLDTEAEAMSWLSSNPSGVYYNALHKFKIHGGKGA